MRRAVARERRRRCRGPAARRASPPVCGHTFAPRSTATVTRRRERQDVDHHDDVTALGEDLGADGSPLQRHGHARERTPEPAERAYPTVSASSSHRSSSTDFSASSRAAPRRGRGPARGRWPSRGHRRCTSRLAVAQPVELPLDLRQLLAGGAGRGGVRSRRRRPRAAAARRRQRRTAGGSGGRRRRSARYSSTPPGRSRSAPSPSSANCRSADPLEEVAVVRDDDQRARPAVEQVLERGQRVDVEVVGRLVEQQHVRLVHEQPQQLQPPPLAAGEVADRGPLARRR